MRRSLPLPAPLSLVPLLLLVAGCGPASVKVGDDTGADSGGDSGTDSGGDSGGDSGDSGEDLGPAVGDLAARVHDTIGSIVVVSWTQLRVTDEVWVEFAGEDGEVWTTPVEPGTEGAHEALLLGLPYDGAVTWRVVTAEAGAPTAVEGPGLDTDPLPDDLPEIELGITDPEAWDPDGRFLLTSVSREDAQQTTRPEFWVVLIDRAGRYVWAVPADPASWTLFPKPSRDGRRILYDDSLFWTEFDGGQDGRVHRLTIEGVEERSWATPGLAHAYDDVSEDTIVWFATERGDELLIRTDGAGVDEELWSCADWVRAEGLDGGTGGCGTNGLAWSPERNSYTVSLWTHEAVVELDADSFAPRWFADPEPGDGYALGPDDPVWHWQHEAHMIDGERLLLSSGVDPSRNGDFRATATYVYAIDHDAQTLTLEFAYEADDEWVARYKGGTHLTPNGHYLQSYGSGGGFQEFTADGTPVWQAQVGAADGSWTGRAYWLTDLYAFVE